MESLQLLNEFEKILSVDNEVKEYCRGALEWIALRKKDWEFDKIRVGVIGVTSSGKSTLINAILGNDILSSAVSPSSGQLVCCTYGNEPIVTIRFQDGTIKILKGTDYNQNILKEYSDERGNPNNEKRVLSIELCSPDFDINKDVLLIDSPGIDAYGLEVHEKITYETLIPTIDTCIFVTTMKTNSDRKAAEILNVVAKYKCPLVIVQNMLDSVRPSPSGAKSREQVAQDHYDRVNRIVQKSTIHDKNQVKIVQISAEYAKQWRCAKGAESQLNITQNDYKDSHYEEFKNLLNNIIKTQKPKIEQQRIRSIQSYFEILHDSIAISCITNNEKLEKEFPLKDLSTHIEKKEVDIKKRYNNIKTEKEKKISEIQTKLESKLVSLEINGCIKDTNTLVTNYGKEILSLIQECNEFVQKCAEKINIPSRDLLQSFVLENYKDINLEKKTEKNAVKEKDSGILGKVKRAGGVLLRNDDWGYHTEYKDVIVTDIDATISSINERLASASKNYCFDFEKWYKNTFNTAINKIVEEINRAEKSYNARKEAEIKTEKIQQLKKNLEIFLVKTNNDNDTPIDVNDVEQPKGDTVKTLKKINTTNLISSILQLSRLAIKKQHMEIAHRYFEEQKCIGYVPIIIGWDEGCIKELIWQTGITNAKIFTDIKSNELTQIQKCKRCFFIFINTIQFGSAYKQIADLTLNKFINDDDFVIWVVQDFQELMINQNNVKEGLRNMLGLKEQVGINCESIVWLIHENPIYNFAFLEAQKQKIRTINEENSFVGNLKNKYEVYCDENVIKNISNIIRSIN